MRSLVRCITDARGAQNPFLHHCDCSRTHSILYSQIPHDILHVLLLHLPLLLPADVLFGLLVQPHGQRSLLLALLDAQVLQVLLLLLILSQQLLILDTKRKKYIQKFNTNSRDNSDRWIFFFCVGISS